MSYEEFYKKVLSIVKEHYSEVNIANKVIATLEQFRLDQVAAEHQMHLTDGGLSASDSESKVMRAVDPPSLAEIRSILGNSAGG